MANPKLLKDDSDIIEDYKAQSIVEEVTDIGPPARLIICLTGHVAQHY